MVAVTGRGANIMINEQALSPYVRMWTKERLAHFKLSPRGERGFHRHTCWPPGHTTFPGPENDVGRVFRPGAPDG